MGSGHGERRARRRQSRAQRKQRRGGFSDDGGGYGSKDGAAGAAAEEHDRYKLYERFRDDSHVGQRLVEDGYKSPVNDVATRVTVQGMRAGECELTRDVPSNSRCAWRRRSRPRRRRWGMVLLPLNEFSVDRSPPPASQPSLQVILFKIALVNKDSLRPWNKPPYDRV